MDYESYKAEPEPVIDGNIKALWYDFVVLYSSRHVCWTNVPVVVFTLCLYTELCS